MKWILVLVVKRGHRTNGQLSRKINTWTYRMFNNNRSKHLYHLFFPLYIFLSIFLPEGSDEIIFFHYVAWVSGLPKGLRSRRV